MRNIIKSALRLPQPTTTQTATSSCIEDTRALLASQTTYSKRMTPSERRAEAVKWKIANEFAASSSDSADEGSASDANKKRKIDHAKEAQCSHRKMCEKAMDTMEFVKDMLTKITRQLASASTRLKSEQLNELLNRLSRGTWLQCKFFCNIVKYTLCFFVCLFFF